jgi:hypothetical protein
MVVLYTTRLVRPGGQLPCSPGIIDHPRLLGRKRPSGPTSKQREAALSRSVLVGTSPLPLIPKKIFQTGSSVPKTLFTAPTLLIIVKTV